MQATLDPNNEVPQPTLGSSTPSGTVMITVNPDSLGYKISAMGLSSPVTAAHIHSGAPGVAGPVIVTLKVAPGSDPSTASGEGTIDASAIKGKNADGSPMTMKDLISALQSGGTYVNVHTQNNKPGEIRAQMTP
jgi:CHRD domain-containing protein